MKTVVSSLIGIGIYTIPEAARLTGVAPARIKRWISGYDFKTRKGAQHHSAPLWSTDLEPLNGIYAVSFRDLVEIRFVDSFLSAGVPWKELREASAEAAELLSSSHPFSTYKFKTDGRRIFAEVVGHLKQTKLLQLTRSQYVFQQVIAPSLFEGFEYEANELLRWRPKSGLKMVVLDPQRGFGQPITDKGSVPTSILFRAVNAEGEGSEEKIARWYDIPLQSVRAALAFENDLLGQRQIKTAA